MKGNFDLFEFAGPHVAGLCLPVQLGEDAAVPGGGRDDPPSDRGALLDPLKGFEARVQMENSQPGRGCGGMDQGPGQQFLRDWHAADAARTRITQTPAG